MASSRARVRRTAVAVFILFALVVAARGAAEVADCPLAGKRPPDDFLTQGSRPSLCKADLRGANLPAANLGGADLPKAGLGSANLRGADLRGANLAGANLGEADLREANFSGANLTDADLGRANLANVNLSAANLANAKGLTCDQIRAAHTAETTHLPATLKCAK